MEVFVNKRNCVRTAGFIFWSVLAALFSQSSGGQYCWEHQGGKIACVEEECSFPFGPAPDYKPDIQNRGCSDDAFGSCKAPAGKCVAKGSGLCCGCSWSLCNNMRTPHEYDNSIPPPPTVPTPPPPPGQKPEPGNGTNETTNSTAHFTHAPSYSTMCMAYAVILTVAGVVHSQITKH